MQNKYVKVHNQDNYTDILKRFYEKKIAITFPHLHEFGGGEIFVNMCLIY